MQSTPFAAKKFKQLSLGFLISASFAIGHAQTASATDYIEEQYIAMLQNAAGTATPDSFKRLSAENMLAMADSLYTPKMSRHQKNLEFALIYSAANKGLAEAQFRLANYFIESDIIAPNESEAAYWLEEAMGQGHQNAKFVYHNVLVYSFDIGC